MCEFANRRISMLLQIIGAFMKSISKFVGALAAVFVCTSGSVFANGGLAVPEPGSLALVGLAVAGLVAVSRKGKK